MAQLVKNPPAIRETWVGSLGWEDPLEKGKVNLGDCYMEIHLIVLYTTILKLFHGKNI